MIESHNYLQIGTFEYEVHRTIGCGGFGKILEVSVPYDDAPHVALKVQRRKKPAENEVHLLKRISHDNIINAYRFIVQKDKIFIQMELMKCDLRKYMSSSLSDAEKHRITVNCLKALAYLHDQHIIHRDIKPENYLVGEGNEIKLADFGLSALVEPGKNLTARAGTAGYMAPEVVEMRPYSHPADWYSLGCTIYELYTSVKFVEVMGPAQAQNTLDCPLVPSFDQAGAHCVVQFLTSTVPEERPRPSAILNWSAFSRPFEA